MLQRYRDSASYSSKYENIYRPKEQSIARG